ncbi:hypothetical protein SADUNF_Sadunf17G0085300 [Salix dunnii]|uniref:Cystathionine gamma-synthase n=1 Tax=Salix dunnii TaxID=1413687 RepID=A0A835MER4_9ROSI|nr:hypothetical protein SADUNF_Sadunf17G0085300 [Salix dunnii]
MAVSSCPCPKLFVASSFECRSDSSSGTDQPSQGGFNSARHVTTPFLSGTGMSSLILKFPPNFVRQLSTKARRNCSNIGVAQIVLAGNEVAGTDSSDNKNVSGVQLKDLSSDLDYKSFLSSDGSIAVHADAITTPVVNTSAYFFKKTQELIDFKEKRHASYEYGRYGNPTTQVLEDKISELEGAESTLILASGMCASTVLLLALVPAGGHLVTTTDCYRKTRIFMETFLPKMGITVTVIDPADVKALESALEINKVSLFFTESPTNPFMRCVDIELVSELCHRKGALVCIDGTFATPLNQKALALGADLILHSATKFIGGHNDVLGGCLSGSTKLVSEIRNLHHVLGGTLNPNAAYLIIRGMKTLHLRVQQQNSTALRMAKILEEHPKVRCVYYPGLPSHPEHHIAKKQMTGFGGVVSFEVDGDLFTTIKFVDALKIPYIAPSFGGCESIVDQPAIMSYWYVINSLHVYFHVPFRCGLADYELRQSKQKCIFVRDLSRPEREKYGIKDNLIRFSFGVEDFEDLKADILQALETI